MHIKIAACIYLCAGTKVSVSLLTVTVSTKDVIFIWERNEDCRSGRKVKDTIRLSLLCLSSNGSPFMELSGIKLNTGIIAEVTEVNGAPR